MILRKGDQNATVARLQEWLNELGFKYVDASGRHRSLVVDGDFGSRTEEVVLTFQESEGLYTDGIVGPLTFKALEKAYYDAVRERDSPADSFVSETQFTLEPVLADKYDQGYSRFQIRSDVAKEYQKIRREVLSQGGILTSSGGIRNLNARLNSNRSAVSFHYVGRALDLFVYSAMVNPKTDPYVVTKEGDRYYRVYARCKTDWAINPKEPAVEITLPEERTLTNIVTYHDRLGQNTGSITGHFLDLTEVFDQHDFKRIRARRSFTNGGSQLGAEWWHFQYEKGLIKGTSTFGEELLKLYSKGTLEDTPPWKQRERIFGVNWF